MRRDGTTWVIAGVGGAGGGPPQGPVGRFKPKHPRAREATAVRMRGNGGNAGSGSTKQSRLACAAAGGSPRTQHDRTLLTRGPYRLCLGGAHAQPNGCPAAGRGPRLGETARRRSPHPAPPSERVIAVTTKSDDTVNLEKARQFGRVSEDGHVFVIVDGEEYAVGQLPGASEDEALSYFARKFENVEAQVALLESRLANNAPAADLQKGIASIGSQIGVRNMVGDYSSLQKRLVSLAEQIAELGEKQQQARTENRERALAVREEIVAEAEQIAGQDPDQIHWKNSHARMNELFEAWKKAQREIHLAKSVEDELWKRFRAARTTFDRNRRAHFSQLDDRNARIKRAKEELIARAEELSTSTDWSETSRAYGELMRAWKQVPRGHRRDDDKLWARFRAAQDVFFNARHEAEAAQDAVYAENLKVKEALLEEARALLPVEDIEAAKAAFEKILDRWDAAGRVPRNDLRRVDGELRRIQDEINGAEEAKWKRNDPAKAARANSLLAQIEDSLAELEAELAAAEKGGDSKKIAKAKEALEARRAWAATLQGFGN